MNHKELLTKYIRYVADCEGVDFIEGGYRGHPNYGDQKFTPEEWAELERLQEVANS